VQNIPIRTPEGVRIREAFIAAEGELLLSADYSQVELRILAHYSGDESPIDAFRRCEDIHRRTAAEVAGIAPGEVSDEQRAQAKAVNFGIIYGSSAFGLAKQLGIFKLTGEKRLFDINSLDEWRTQAYEDAKLFKEKVKRWHNKRIQKWEFKVDDQVLLYNSRFRFFAGKLLSKWEGPYIIEEVYRSGAIKLKNSQGTNLRVVNGQRIKHYISGMPINMETNIIQTMTPEEHIKETFQNTPEP
jgi:hypothetical protein